MKKNKTEINIKIAVAILLILITIATATAQTTTESNLENPELKITLITNNQIQITTNPENKNKDYTDQYEIRIQTENTEYKYYGQIIFPINYNLPPGKIYTIYLVDKQTKKTISQKQLELKTTEEQPSQTHTITQITENNQLTITQTNETNNCTSAKINLSTNNITLGQSITINLQNYTSLGTELQLTIQNQNDTDKYLGTFTTATYIPIKTGEYQVILQCNTQKIQTKNFTVNEQNQTSIAPQNDIIQEKINSSLISTSMAILKREMPDGVGSKRAIEVDYIIGRTTNKTLMDPYIIDYIPYEFTQIKSEHTYYAQNNIDGYTQIMMPIQNITTNNLKIIRIEIQAPETEQNITFNKSPQLIYTENQTQYMTQNNQTQKLEITKNTAHFKIEIDTNPSTPEQERTLNQNETTPIKVLVKNIGNKDVTEYPTFFKMPINPQEIQITKKDITKGCEKRTITTENQNTIMQCEWKTFYQNETKEFYIYLKKETAEPIEDFTTQINTTYDPPKEIQDPGLNYQKENEQNNTKIQIQITNTQNPIIQITNTQTEITYINIQGKIHYEIDKQYLSNNEKSSIKINNYQKQPFYITATTKNQTELIKFYYVENQELNKETTNSQTKEEYQQKQNIEEPKQLKQTIWTKLNTLIQTIWTKIKTIFAGNQITGAVTGQNIEEPNKPKEQSIKNETPQNETPQIQIENIKNETQKTQKIPNKDKNQSKEKIENKTNKTPTNTSNTTVEEKKSSSHSRPSQEKENKKIIKIWYSTINQPTIRFIQNNQPTTEQQIIQKTKIQNSKQERLYAQITPEINNKTNKTNILINLEKNEEFKDSKIKINDLQTNQDIIFNIEKLNKDYNLTNQTNKSIINAFAMDFSNLNFTNGTYTAKAKGTELWKCKEWNFTTQTCYGTWTKIQNILPGQNYAINIYPEDPGYLELGITTINTRKPTYYPNETVEIIAIVLDDEGRLFSGANMTINIDYPDEYNITYKNSQINETSPGTYILYHPETRTPGTYLLEAIAESNGTTINMKSYFLVSLNYPYDITRYTDAVIDPFVNPLTSTVNINPKTTNATYNYTEILSSNFTNITTNGAIIQLIENSYYITWTNLNGNTTIYYTAEAPKISPAIITIGPSYINYQNETFYEARPWYLALDPTLTDTGMSVSPTSEQIGNTVTATGNIFCTGGGSALDYDLWLEDDGVQIDTTTTGVDISCSGTGDVNIVSCGAKTCTANSDCSITVVDCGNNDAITVEWTLTLEGDNEALPSSNTLQMDASIGNSLNNQASLTITDFVDTTNPTTTLNNPAPNYINSNATQEIINFNCSATDDTEIDTISFYITNSQNTSFSYNDSCTASSGSQECIFTKTITLGNYTWNCLTNDTTNNQDWGTNRTITINGSESTFANIIGPENNTYDGDGNILFQCNAQDDTDIENITLYTNHTGSWQQRNVTTFSGSTDTNVYANITINNIANNTQFIWSCLTEDNTGVKATSENYTITTLYTNEQPIVVLDSPENDTTQSTETITFTCNATDNSDLASINLYTNRTGIFQFEDTKQYTGNFEDSETATFQLTGFADETNVAWNCKAIDNNSNEAFASANRTIYVDFQQPTVNLTSPSDYSYDIDGDVTLECNVTDNSDITNITLYHNINGNWQKNQTLQVSGLTDTEVTVQFNITGITYGTTFQWNCLATDEDSLQGIAQTNYTLTIPPIGQNYYAPNTYSGGTWSNPERADEIPDTITANQDLDDQTNLYVYNFSGMPTQGTLLEASLSMRWSVSTTPTNDYLGLQYSPDSATNYYSLSGTLDAYTQPTTYPLVQTNTSHPITSSLTLAQLQTTYYRITGIKSAEPDNVNTQIDAIWLTARISPPPQYSNIGKNQTIIYENQTINFYTNWEDDINLDCFIFSINKSTGWSNSSCIDLQGKNDNATYQEYINTTPGTTVQWRFYARDNFGDYNQTPIQTFTIIDPNDTTFPQITNVKTQPNPTTSPNNINISATITDNIAVMNATVEITLPSGEKENITLTQETGNNWSTTYSTTQGGMYNYTIYATDGASNTNTTTGHNFNVTSNITANKKYYDRSETATITGYGFSANSDVEYNIINQQGTSQTGFPKNETSNTIGTATTTWQIPSILTFETGTYNITGIDTKNDNLTNQTTIQVVIKPDQATKTDNIAAGDPIKSQINESDDTQATIVGDTAETYAELRYQDIIAEGYSLDDLILHVEHTDLDTESDTIDIQYYNGATWSVATCGSLTYRATETIDTCNLTPDLGSIPDKNDIRIRLSDGNDGNEGADFTKIDFAYLTIAFSITNNLAVTINYPDYITTTYDYTDSTSNSAYEGPATALPTTTQYTGTEASSSEYTWLANSDNNRWQTIVTNSGESAYQNFFFTVSQSEQDINILTIMHEGYATQRTSLDADPYRIYLWDYTNTVYDLISDNPITGTTSDKTTTIEITSGVQDYVDTNGEINVLIQADYTLGGCGNPSNCRGDMVTDYISVDVNSYRTIGGTTDINVTAVDGDGVQSCTYTFINDTLQTEYTLYNISSTIWTNQSDTGQYADGLYNISINCTDGTEVNDSKYVTVRVLNIAPYLELKAPENNTNFTNNAVNFTWNATSQGGNPVCDIYIDESEELTDVVSQSGQNTTREITNITDGSHQWYARCNIAGGTYNTSETRNFTIDTTKPGITINSPENNHVTNQAVTFNYTPYDANELANCSLYINDQYNDTNSTIQNNQPSTFIKNLAEGTHNWTINCTDNFGYTNISETRTIIIDTTKPTITLSNPDPEQLFLGGLVQFNYTATDNQDTNMLCNITIDGNVEDENIPTTNATPKIRNLIVGDGFKEWNVTCIDNANNHNTSETRNFTVQGPPTVTLQNPGINAYLSYQTINFTYYAEDSDGLTNCSIYIDNQYNDTNFTPQNASVNNFTKTLNEGKHNWSIQCYDGLNNKKQTDYRNLTVDITPPNITLHDPENDTNQTDQQTEFNFTVTDNLDQSLTCNLTINGQSDPTNRNFEATNGSYTTRTQTGITPGDNYWNITCIDDAGYSHTSETRYFFMEGIPTIQLISPDNATQDLEQVYLTYQPTDKFGLYQCYLYINEQYNSTETNPINGSYNQFQINFTGEQRVYWYVMCENDYNINGTSDTYYFDVDITPPTINLTYPPNQSSIQNSTIDFKFNATDNNATILYCDLYLDGNLNVSDIEPTSGQEETVQITGISEGEHYWNVTCSDYAGNTNSSQNYNFTISYGPSVSLINPPDNNVTNNTNVTFQYTVTTPSIDACWLIINEQTNKSNQSVILTDGSNNNITLTDLAEQTLNWTIQCNDTTGTNSTIDETRTINIDRTNPSITLNYPEPQDNISLSFIQFNFTPQDNLDEELSCTINVYNITGIFNTTTINATNNEDKIHTVYNFTTGTYYWNVTCSDGLNTNNSETRNFTISNIPQIMLQNPYNEYSDPDGFINFSYIPQTIATGGWQYCIFILDGTQNDSEVVIQNGETNYFSINLTESGYHTWQINCTDQDDLNGSSEIRNFSIDLENPTINTNYPDGQTLNSTVEFNFTALDNIDQELVCAIYINGTQNTTGINAQNGSYTYQNITGFTDGDFEYYINCTDDSNRTNISTTKTFTVQEPPSITLNSPEQNHRTKQQNISFNFTPTDNSGTITSCTLILNGQANETINAPNSGEQTNITLTNLQNGLYNWTINCTDPSGNEGTNQTTRNLTIDLYGPTFQINTPYSGETFNYNDIIFNWTATDQFGTDLTCNLTLDETVNVTNMTGTSEIDFTQQIENLTEGPHNWSVTCWDDLNNTNTSNTTNFMINSPDLTLNNTDITFSNSNPDLYENITIHANISNIGGIDAENALIEFWNGQPGTGTIIGNTTINVTVNGSTTANIYWNITEGYHNIWIIIDPYETLVELNDTNNNATTNISVLRSLLNEPQNNTWTNNSLTEINFTLQDYTENTINYTIYVNEAINTAGEINDNTTTLLNITLTEGYKNITIEALDALGRRKNSTTIIRKVDLNPPSSTINTENNTWYNDTTPQINITVTDNVDNILNYTIYVEGTSDLTNYTTSGIPKLENLSTLIQGKYQIILESYDEVGFYDNSTPTYIYVDTTPPQTQLNLPQDGANFSQSNVNLNFTVTDNMATQTNQITCDLYVDGNIYSDNTSATNGSLKNIEVTNLEEGNHNWSVTCWDPAQNYNSTETRTFNVFIPPTIILISPENNYWSNNENQTFYFNVTDDTGIENCSILLNGQINDTKNTTQITNNATNNFTINYLSGTYNWSIECYDNSTFNTHNISQNRTINIDLENPNATIITQNNSWFNTDPEIEFNITDNMDTQINYTFYVNGASNQTGTKNNASLGTETLIGLLDGSYNILIEAIDEAGNKFNSTQITINIDRIKPTINLTYPENDTNFTQTTLDLNFTVTDNIDTQLICNLTLDGSTYAQNIPVNNATEQNITATNLLGGFHYWNVTCIDKAGNYNTSTTKRFYIIRPDLTINQSKIYFNNTDPRENETINITATIENIGTSDAYDFIAQLWKGNPQNGGTQINGNFTLNLTSGESKNISVNITVDIGTTQIFVLVDAPIETNGSIGEENETNNQQSKNITVASWHYAFGQTGDKLVVRDANNGTLFDWIKSNSSGSNLFAVDSDSEITWTQIQALGRDTSNNSIMNDFENLDLALGSENYTDNVNTTFTETGNPKETTTYTIFGKTINNIPIHNSTNNTNFKTGILWDYSDGGTQYTGTQDIIFMSQIKDDIQGYNATYDYEIRMPAKLRDYKGTTKTVDFYIEIR